ncbi:MAG: hypothetical protein AAFQ63_22980 [Cyanobacteria bacterium J06621_11]
MDDYKPIGCDLYDRLEAIATLKKTVKLSYVTANDATKEIIGKIVDIYAEEGADYCKLSNGTTIRLDRLASVIVDDISIL